MEWIQIVGYAGSILIAVSITMNNIWKLRWINLFGAGTFAVYGLVVQAYPVFALNSFITFVDVYYLIQMSRKKDYFTLTDVPEGSYLFLQKFLQFYREDIRSYFPGFNWAELPNPQCVFILRNLIPVGLFIYEPHPDGVAEIHLDYVRPEYRDLKNAHFLYSAQKENLNAKGLFTFVTRSSIKAHQSYLEKLGFEPDPANRNLYRKPI